jgi:hypothetical protein
LILDTENKEQHHIFFDDNLWWNNLEESGKLIVDVRDLDGNALDPKKFMDKYLVKVDPMEAILNVNYFKECVEKCELNVR